MKKFTKRSEKSFKLWVQDSGDSSVGIPASSFEIETFYPEMEEDYRDAARAIFAAAVIKLTDFPVRYAKFEDECPECNKIMKFFKRGQKYVCRNENCPSNQPDPLE